MPTLLVLAWFWFGFGSVWFEAEPKPYQTDMSTYVHTYVISTIVLYAIFFKSYRKLTFAETVVVLFMYHRPVTTDTDITVSRDVHAPRTNAHVR